MRAQILAQLRRRNGAHLPSLPSGPARREQTPSRPAPTRARATRDAASSGVQMCATGGTGPALRGARQGLGLGPRFLLRIQRPFRPAENRRPAGSCSRSFSARPLRRMKSTSSWSKPSRPMGLCSSAQRHRVGGKKRIVESQHREHAEAAGWRSGSAWRRRCWRRCLQSPPARAPR